MRPELLLQLPHHEPALPQVRHGQLQLLSNQVRTIFAADHRQPVPVDLEVGPQSQCRRPRRQPVGWQRKRHLARHPAGVPEARRQFDPVPLRVSCLQRRRFESCLGLPGRERRLRIGEFDPAVGQQHRSARPTVQRLGELHHQHVFPGQSAQEPAVESSHIGRPVIDAANL